MIEFFDWMNEITGGAFTGFLIAGAIVVIFCGTMAWITRHN